jgi:hypothetical protein
MMADVGQFDDASDDEEELVPVIEKIRAEGAKAVDAMQVAASSPPVGDRTDLAMLIVDAALGARQTGVPNPLAAHSTVASAANVPNPLAAKIAGSTAATIHNNIDQASSSKMQRQPQTLSQKKQKAQLTHLQQQQYEKLSQIQRKHDEIQQQQQLEKLLEKHQRGVAEGAQNNMDLQQLQKDAQLLLVERNKDRGALYANNANEVAPHLQAAFAPPVLVQIPPVTTEGGRQPAATKYASAKATDAAEEAHAKIQDTQRTSAAAKAINNHNKMGASSNRLGSGISTSPRTSAPTAPPQQSPTKTYNTGVDYFQANSLVADHFQHGTSNSSRTAAPIAPPKQSLTNTYNTGADHYPQGLHPNSLAVDRFQHQGLHNANSLVNQTLRAPILYAPHMMQNQHHNAYSTTQLAAAAAQQRQLLFAQNDAQLQQLAAREYALFAQGGGGGSHNLPQPPPSELDELHNTAILMRARQQKEQPKEKQKDIIPRLADRNQPKKKLQQQPQHQIPTKLRAKLTSQRKQNEEDAAEKRPARKKPRIVERAEGWAVVDAVMQSPVICAARYVGNELQHGMWPSPSLVGDRPFDNKLGAERQHKAHMKTVAAALDRFCVQVLLPAMQQPPQRSSGGPQSGYTRSGDNNQNIAMCIPTNKKKGPPKSFFATLLALREVMTQNAERIFGKESLDAAVLDEDEEERATTTTTSSYNGRNTDEDRHFCAQLLATGVTIAAIERCLPDHRDKTTERFLESVKAYDDGDDEFLSCLQVDQGNIRSVLPNGKRLNADEEVARNVSFNQARKRHPMVQRDVEKRLKMKPRQLILVPEVNACHVSVIEKLSDWIQR